MRCSPKITANTATRLRKVPDFEKSKPKTIMFMRISIMQYNSYGNGWTTEPMLNQHRNYRPVKNIYDNHGGQNVVDSGSLDSNIQQIQVNVVYFATPKRS